jgi:hypothetical protein
LGGFLLRKNQAFLGSGFRLHYRLQATGNGFAAHTILATFVIFWEKK